MLDFYTNISIFAKANKPQAMDNQNLKELIEKNSSDIEALRKSVGVILSLLERMSSAVNEGFKEVNDRLSVLEGKQGMQGVNQQLGEIKTELHKIQQTYPYGDEYDNMKSIHGQA